MICPSHMLFMEWAKNNISCLLDDVNSVLFKASGILYFRTSNP